MSAPSFARATLAARLAALCGRVPAATDSSSDLFISEARLAGRAVMLVASDPARQLGTLGPAECAAFEAALERARAARLPLVLLFDSAGARLDAGLVIQGALRRLVRALLDARLDGLPMYVLVGRYAFGAASMLVGIAPARALLAETLVGMSGPRVIQGVAHADEAAAVMRGSARSKAQPTDRLLDDSLSACSADLAAWLARAAATESWPVQAGQEKEETIAFGGGQPAGAQAVRALAARIEAGCHVHIDADCPGHSLQVEDEAAGLGMALVGLALAIRHAVRSGRRITVRLHGQISGGIYLALAAGATRVELAHGARVLTLPPSSLQAILGDAGDAEHDAAACLALGVTDFIL